jgi:hypothetical protein
MNRATIRHILAAVRNPVAACRAIKSARHGKPTRKAIRDGKARQKHWRWHVEGEA